MLKNEKDWNWKATIEENIRLGYSELLILHLLSIRDMYGYEMKKVITDLTGNSLIPVENSLYIPLLRMESRGLITSRQENVIGKRFRTYYHIEDFGKQYLEYGKEQFITVSESVKKVFDHKE